MSVMGLCVRRVFCVANCGQRPCFESGVYGSRDSLGDSQVVQFRDVVEVRYVQVAVAVVGVDEMGCGDEEVISTRQGVVAANRGHVAG
jgi:hypothetical protein